VRVVSGELQGHDGEVADALTTDAPTTGVPTTDAPTADAPTTGDQQPRGRSRSRRLGIGWLLAAGMVYLAVGVGADWGAWTSGHLASTATCACGDPAQTMWFLAWVPDALGHGQWPWHSNLLFAGQGGVNLLANTGDFLQGLLVAPVTVLAGPPAALNVAITVAPVASGLSALWAATKVMQWRLGALLVGLVWACSPIVLGHAPYGHLNLAWAVGPPLLFGALWELAVVQQHSWRHDATVLSAAVVATFFVSTEQLVLCVLVAGAVLAGALAVAAIRGDPDLRRRLGHGGRAGVAAVAGVGLILGWPTWSALAGPRHTIGPPWPGTAEAGAAPGAPLLSRDHLVSRGLAALAGYRGSPGPALDYLGPILIVALVGSMILAWRHRSSWILLGGAVGCWVLSWGVTAGYWTPWRLFDRLPVLDEVTPDRFGALALFLVVMVIGVGFEAAGRPAVGDRARWWRRPWRGLLLTVVLAGLVLAGAAGEVVAEGLPYPVVRAAAPAWFTGSTVEVAPRSRVLVLPYPSSGITVAMAWQAMGGLRFALVGGYGLVPPAHQTAGPAIHHPAPASFDGLLDALTFGFHALPTATVATLATLWAGIHAAGVDTVVVAPVPADAGPTPAVDFGPAQAGYAAGLIAAAVGRPPHWQDGAWVFTAVRHDPGPLAG